MPHKQSPVSGMGWGMPRAAFPVSRRDWAAADRLLEDGALADQLLAEGEGLAAEGFRQAGSGSASQTGSEIPATVNVRARYVS